MRINKIEVKNLLYRYPSEEQYMRNAAGLCNARVTTLVWVHTDEGVSGIGSVYSHPDLVRLIVENHLQDMLIGRNPLEVEAIWDLNYDLTRWYGRKGVALSAIGGIDTALWDIRGKVAGKPVYQLLGGLDRRVEAYASGMVWQEDVSALRVEALRHRSNGFRAMKMRVGCNPRYDRRALRIVREAIGFDVKLMADANSRYSPTEVASIMDALQEAKIFWLEEPFPVEEAKQYAELYRTGQIPIAAGENEFGLQGFRELIETPLVNFVQPDCSRSGGITECYRIGKLAGAHGIRLVTHTWSDAVALTANLHLVAALDNGIMVEVDQTGNELITRLLSCPLEFQDGFLYAPDAPGLGISVNEEALEEYVLPAGMLVPSGNYADMAFGSDHYGTPKLEYV